MREGADSKTWAERQGTAPKEKKDFDKNEKWFEPTEMTLLFCGNQCNQSHKDVEAEAIKAAHGAWLTVYNRRKA